MDEKQRRALLLCGTDIEGAINRLCGNEQLYISCLRMFLDDPTVEEMNRAVENNDWDGVFTAAHALKGLVGNMGFVPLMHAAGQLVIMVRGGRMKEVGEYLAQVNSCYRGIIGAIRDNFFTTETEIESHGNRRRTSQLHRDAVVICGEMKGEKP